jgi:hypothetical protein
MGSLTNPQHPATARRKRQRPEGLCLFITLAAIHASYFELSYLLRMPAVHRPSGPVCGTLSRRAMGTLPLRVTALALAEIGLEIVTESGRKAAGLRGTGSRPAIRAWSLRDTTGHLHTEFGVEILTESVREAAGLHAEVRRAIGALPLRGTTEKLHTSPVLSHLPHPINQCRRCPSSTMPGGNVLATSTDAIDKVSSRGT